LEFGAGFKPEHSDFIGVLGRALIFKNECSGPIARACKNLMPLWHQIFKLVAGFNENSRSKYLFANIDKPIFV